MDFLKALSMRVLRPAEAYTRLAQGPGEKVTPGGLPAPADAAQWPGAPLPLDVVAPACQVAVLRWDGGGGITQVLCDELAALGYDPRPVSGSAGIPPDTDVVFSFGPYGQILPALTRLARLDPVERPVYVHWNTEGLPDPRIPWSLLSSIGRWRSWLGRAAAEPRHPMRYLTGFPPLSWANMRMQRYRFLGDYLYAHRHGWIDVFADTSAVYAQIRTQHGMPTLYAPWGATPRWYADLRLERDIDVLWMGKRATRRRNRLLDRVCRELEARDVRMYIADAVQNPFLFEEERTQYLNRAKITLNLTRTWYDDNFSRFAMVAPNRSLFVSEPLLPHCPQLEPGVHYVSAPVEELVDVILYYLAHEEERMEIVENAYRAVTVAAPLRKTIETMMNAARSARRAD
jgi:hypothetical protein